MRYDDVIASSTTAAELLDTFGRKLCETIADEAPMHRLWYDLRSQSMFEPGLTDAVGYIDSTLSDMIWRVLVRYAELADAALVTDAASAYAMLAQQREPDDQHLDRLQAQVRGLLPLLIGRPGQ